MKSSEIRQRFLDFFQARDHRVQDSAPLLTSDPDLLFNIAGMVPFKPYFLGKDDPPDSRMTTAQKCIRTEDIEQVGETARHLTFFEMLGNFSFGDYFKDDAIKYGWDFFVEEMNLDPDRLWITVFGGDEELDPDTEAEELWRDLEGVPDERVLRLGRAENFWAMGPTGPCGPCSEILYDQESASEDPETVKRLILDGADRVLELWNLVFMEFERPEEGAELQPLPQKNIDTGLGLERLAAIVQDADSNFGTDLFGPLMDDVREMIGRDFDDSREASGGRVIADHLRASAFLLSEGLLPGNEGRGYVLRRLIRRAHRRGRRLGLRKPFLQELVPTLIEIMGDHFKELKENKNDIQEKLAREAEQFERILDEGLSELDDRIQILRDEDESTMSGENVFDLYETHGLPLEMTKEVLDEEGIDYDEDEIQDAIDQHEERSRDGDETDSNAEFDFENVPETDFIGYEELESSAEIKALYRGENGERVDQIENDPEQTVFVVFDETPFYAEGGGQSGDQGFLDETFKIINTTEDSGRHLHRIRSRVKNKWNPLKVGQSVHLRVNENFRRANMRHHTATHLLHHALRRELGDQVIQDGSYLDDEYLRFDFTYDEALDRATLDGIEAMINNWIYEEIPIRTERMSRDEAEEKGALAFFGEHYGQDVRVVSIVDDTDEEGPDSKEFCGGTHLDNTGRVGLFTITNETAVAAGVRRIEAKAGLPAYNHLAKQRERLRNAAAEAGVQQLERLEDRIASLRETIADQESEIERLRQKQGAAEAAELIDRAEQIGEVLCVTETFEGYDSETLKQMLDEIHNLSESSVVLLASRNDGAVQLVLGVSDDLTENYNAGDIIGEIGSIVGGGGGGRADFAQAGGSNSESLSEAVDRFKEIVREGHAETAGH